MFHAVLSTPLGEIGVFVDGKPYPCQIEELERDERLCPDVDGRHKLIVMFEPDGKKHTISCQLMPSQPVEEYDEPGERLECASFFDSKHSVKVSVGIQAFEWYEFDDVSGEIKRSEFCEFDYDGHYEESNGMHCMSYFVLPQTKTNRYRFCIAWINHCNESNEVQTWFAVDP